MYGILHYIYSSYNTDLSRATTNNSHPLKKQRSNLQEKKSRKKAIPHHKLISGAMEQEKEYHLNATNPSLLIRSMSSVTVNTSAVQSQRKSQCEKDRHAFSSTSPLSVALDPRIVSGSFGSIVSAVVTTPFEVVKVKLQRFNPPSLPSASNFYAAASKKHPTGPISMLRHVIATEGVRGAYAGLTPTVMMSIPSYLLFLLSCDELEDAMRVHTSFSETTTIPLASGALARLLASSAVLPMELIRTRHAATSSQNHGISHVWTEIRTIVRNDGIKALYKGMTPQLLRDVPFASLYMLFLERTRDLTRPILLADSNGNVNVNRDKISARREMAFEFVNAAAAGMMAATCTAPLDVVKTRFQSCQNASAKPSIPNAILSIIEKEGISGLWRGNQARMLKVAPQYAIMISCYEVGKKVLV